MKLAIYVNYPGTCAAAFRFYERHLGGKITLMRTHEDQPSQPGVPADWKKAILHARIEIGDAILMGADIPGAEPMRSAYLTLRVDSAKEAERLYALLGEGRCFVIACRVTPVPSLSRVIESGPSTDRRRSRLSRVASPSAANSTGALRLRDIHREILDLPAPPLGVHAERLGPARERDPIEPRLDDRERRPALSLLEREFDQRHGLGRVVHRGVLRVRVPAVREIPFGLDPLDLHFDFQMLVARNGDPAPHRLALGERAVEGDPEPRAFESRNAG